MSPEVLSNVYFVDHTVMVFFMKHQHLLAPQLPLTTYLIAMFFFCSHIFFHLHKKYYLYLLMI